MIVVISLNFSYVPSNCRYEGGKEIVYVKPLPVKSEKKEDDEEATPMSTPVCQECRSKRILDFSSTNVIVRVYPPGEPIVAACTDSGSPVPVPTESCTTMETKKRKAPQPVDMSGSRRSKRSKPAKGPFTEHKVVVNKQDTVMDLKLKVTKRTNPQRAMKKRSKKRKIKSGEREDTN